MGLRAKPRKAAAQPRTESLAVSTTSLLLHSAVEYARISRSQLSYYCNLFFNRTFRVKHYYSVCGAGSWSFRAPEVQQRQGYASERYDRYTKPLGGDGIGGTDRAAVTRYFLRQGLRA